MKIKKSSVVVVLFGMTFAMLVGCSRDEDCSKFDEIKIGAILPLTGQFSNLGVDCQEGINAAVDMINARGGVMSRRLKVIYEDSKGDVRTGIAKYRKMQDVDNVNFVICGLSHVAKAVIPIAEKDHRMLIATIASASKFAESSRMMVRIFTSSDVEAREAALFVMNKLHARRLAVLREDSDSGNDARRIFESHINKLGGEIVLDETPEASQKYDNVVAKLRNIEYDAVYVYCGDLRLGNLIKAVACSGKSAPILTLPIVNNDPIKKQIEMLRLPTIYYPDFELTSELKGVLKHSVSTVFGYNIITMLSRTIENIRSVDNMAVLKEMCSIRNVDGAIKGISMTTDGDVDFPMTMKEFHK